MTVMTHIRDNVWRQRFVSRPFAEHRTTYPRAAPTDELEEPHLRHLRHASTAAAWKWAGVASEGPLSVTMRDDCDGRARRSTLRGGGSPHRSAWS